jgi:uncharacterized protein
MTPVFADTFYFLALLNVADEAHKWAVDWTATTRRPMLTTRWVLAEVGDAMAAPLNRGLFVEMLQRLPYETRCEIAAGSDDLFERGLELYRHRPDKEWSFTDCTSFALMSDRGINDALTGDRHFVQAGFRTLFLEGGSMD